MRMPSLTHLELEHDDLRRSVGVAFSSFALPVLDELRLRCCELRWNFDEEVSDKLQTAEIQDRISNVRSLVFDWNIPYYALSTKQPFKRFSMITRLRIVNYHNIGLELLRTLSPEFDGPDATFSMPDLLPNLNVLEVEFETDIDPFRRVALTNEIRK